MHTKRPLPDTISDEHIAAAAAKAEKTAPNKKLRSELPLALNQVAPLETETSHLACISRDTLSHICQYLPTRSFLNLSETCKELSQSLERIPLRQHQTFTLDLLSLIKEIYWLSADEIKFGFSSIFRRCNKLRLSHYGPEVLHPRLAIEREMYLKRVAEALSLFTRVETVILHANSSPSSKSIPVCWPKLLTNERVEHVVAKRVLYLQYAKVKLKNFSWPDDEALTKESQQKTNLVLPNLKHILCGTDRTSHRPYDKESFSRLIMYAHQLETCANIPWLVPKEPSPRCLSMPLLQVALPLPMQALYWLDAPNLTTLTLDTYCSNNDPYWTDIRKLERLKSYTQTVSFIGMHDWVEILKTLPEGLEEVSFLVGPVKVDSASDTQDFVTLSDSLTTIKIIQLARTNSSYPIRLPPLQTDCITGQWKRRSLCLLLADRVTGVANGIVPQHCTDLSVFVGKRTIDLTCFMLDERSQQLQSFFLHDGICFAPGSQPNSFCRERVHEIEHIEVAKRNAVQLDISSLPSTLESLTLECKVRKIMVNSDLPPNMTSLRLPMLTAGVITNAVIDWFERLLSRVCEGKTNLKHFHAAFVHDSKHKRLADLQMTFSTIEWTLAQRETPK